MLDPYLWLVDPDPEPGVQKHVDPVDFLGPNGTRCICCHLRAQKSLDFQGLSLQTALIRDFPASKSIRPAPYKQ